MVEKWAGHPIGTEKAGQRGESGGESGLGFRP